jgi:hypothetical protein
LQPPPTPPHPARAPLRWPSPRDWCQARMPMRPAYSPLAPLLGCRLTASKPVMDASWRGGGGGAGGWVGGGEVAAQAGHGKACGDCTRVRTRCSECKMKLWQLQQMTRHDAA